MVTNINQHGKGNGKTPLRHSTVPSEYAEEEGFSNRLVLFMIWRSVAYIAYYAGLRYRGLYRGLLFRIGGLSKFSPPSAVLVWESCEANAGDMSI